MNRIPITVDELRQKLSGLDLFGVDVIKNIERAILLTRSTAMYIENKIIEKGFHSQEEEIRFFKLTKPPLFSYLIAFQTMLKIEQTRPQYGRKEFKDFVRQKLQFVKAHYIDYPEFSRYFISDRTDQDTRFFLRENRIELDCFPHTYDDRLSTGYDVIAAYLLAYQFLSEHYDKTLNRSQVDPTFSKLTWSADKIAFVELVSGLHAMGCINWGKNDLKTLTTELGQLLNIDIKDIYGKRAEIKERKGDRFRFLTQMSEKLNSDFDDNFD